MFYSARLKLTGFYLLIIMLISIIFSISFYRVATMEYQYGLERIKHRILTSPHFFDLPPQILEVAEELAEAKHHVALRLVYLNGFIFFAAGLAGYFLAGKTLKPIEQTLEEHKRFISDASHELRTPIAALKTTVEVTLRDKTLPKSTIPIFAELLTRLNDLNQLTNNLLRLAKTDRMGSRLFEETPLMPIIEAVIKTVTPLARKKSITIVKNGDTKTQILLADPLALRELLTIVLDNAIHYSRINDTITITTRIKNKNALIQVADTGVGISKHDLPHIFDRFYRADPSRTKSNHSGHGLGLSVAKRIVSEHKGTIAAESSLNHGTTITICLPLMPSAKE